MAMKKILIFVISLVLLSSCSQKAPLTRLSEPLYEIAFDKNADSLTIAAVEQLKYYLEKISGARFRITKNPLRGEKYIYVGKGLLKQDSSIQSIPKLKNDGFLIDIGSNRIIIS
jgi:hypothetical protein